jgi:hypothetical protein
MRGNRGNCVYLESRTLRTFWRHVPFVQNLTTFDVLAVMTFDILSNGCALDGVEVAIPWENLLLVQPHSELQGLSLARADSLGPSGQKTPRTSARESEDGYLVLDSLVEISSGGSVFFCLFPGEKVVVLKFISDRLLCQSEVFASEIAQYLDVSGPLCRIMLPDTEEWACLKAACYALEGNECNDQRESILHCLEKQHSLLVIEYIPGPPLLTSEEAIEDVESIAYELGQVRVWHLARFVLARSEPTTP